MVNISENLEVLEGVKDDIKTAIENKGIVINDTTPFVDYATKINEISIGTGDYQDGYEQGKLDQKALLENRTFRRNGTYSRPDGYGTVVVDVPSGGTGDYDTGFEDGVAAQKAKLTNITITNNGTYTNEDGYNEVIVNIEDTNGSYQDGYNTGIEEGKITGYNSGYTAGETAQKSKLTGITITENGTYLKDDGYNEVIVNVPQTGGTTGSLVLVDGTKFQNSTFTEIPDYYDFSNITDGGNMFLGCTELVTINNLNLTNANEMGRMFEKCESLQSIFHLDSSNATNMYGMFNGCKSLQTIPLIDTRNVTGMTIMFLNCNLITTIPELDTSNVTTMYGMFNLCGSLQTIPSLNTSNVTDMREMFENCRSLQAIPSLNTSNVTNIFSLFGGTDLEYLTDVGGWINLNINWSDGYGLAKCPNLTYQSCINILNGLADMTGTDGRTLKVHQNFLDTVGDEINIGINKNWTITA